MLNHPQWIKVLIVVYLDAVDLKVWQFGSSLKPHLIGATPSIDQFRHTLRWVCAEAQVEA